MSKIVFSSETSEKIHNSTSRVKISVLERKLFKWDGRVIKIWHLFFHRFWKNNFFFKKVIFKKMCQIFPPFNHRMHVAFLKKRLMTRTLLLKSMMHHWLFLLVFLTEETIIKDRCTGNSELFLQYRKYGWTPMACSKAIMTINNTHMPLLQMRQATVLMNYCE